MSDKDEVEAMGEAPPETQLAREIAYTKQCMAFLEERLPWLRSIPRSRESDMAVIKLDEAVMWLEHHVRRLEEIEKIRQILPTSQQSKEPQCQK